MNLNYTELKDSIHGMVSKSHTITNNDDFYIIKKNKNKLYCMPKGSDKKYDDLISEQINNCKTLTFGYVFDKDFQEIKNNNALKITSKSWSESIISVFEKDFFNLHGKSFIEIRETRNKYNKIVVCEKYDLTNKEKINNKINDLLEEWDSTSGEKYGWHRHSGYDRSFFNKLNECNISDYQIYLFYIGNDLVGYSVISLNNKENCYSYIIRKSKIDFRNICLYIDYKSFELLKNNQNINDAFYIHWGASSGNLLKYKKKFPIHSLTKTWFFTVKK